MECLPTEMIAEILARVAAASAADLFRCEQSCKALQEIAAEKQVLQQVAIEGLYSCTWRNADRAQYFFKRCQESDNPEALYRLGMVQHFSQLMKEEGLRNLEKAAAQGHKDAIYVLSLTLLRNGDNESMKKGVNLLVNLMEVVKGKGIIERRKKLRELMHTLQWMRTYCLDSRSKPEMAHTIEEPTITCNLRLQHDIDSEWKRTHYYDEQVEDDVICETCKCHREVGFFYATLADFDVHY